MTSKSQKPQEIRKSNILAAKALSDAVRTSLGPKGMDKMIQVRYDESSIYADDKKAGGGMPVITYH